MKFTSWTEAQVKALYEFEKPKTQQASTATPTKNLTLEEKDIVGTYEGKIDGGTYRWVFLVSRITKYYQNGNNLKQYDCKWSIVDNEIHMIPNNGDLTFFGINPDNSITKIAYIRDGKRTDFIKELQWTYKKIK